MPFPPPGALLDPGVESTCPALADRFFTTEPPKKPFKYLRVTKIYHFLQRCFPSNCFILTILGGVGEFQQLLSGFLTIITEFRPMNQHEGFANNLQVHFHYIVRIWENNFWAYLDPVNTVRWTWISIRLLCYTVLFYRGPGWCSG